jgi:hypothetical protein
MQHCRGGWPSWLKKMTASASSASSSASRRVEMKMLQLRWLLMASVGAVGLQVSTVKTTAHAHNYEHGQVPMVTDLHMRPVIGFLCLGTEAGGVYKRTLGAEIRHPHLATGWASVLTWGEIIRSRPGWLPLASKTARLDDQQLYFFVAHHTQVGVLRKNLSTEQVKIQHGD